ncbi:MAG: lysine--tRNA ligase, partial [bacterium]|nr:lysine--tRNA ligase [bacterium]
MASRLDTLREVRLEKLKKLQKAGVNAYPAKTNRTHTTNEAREESENSKVSVAGRVTGWRGHGGSVFADIEDLSGKIQIYLQEDKLKKEDFENLNLLDLGDFLEVTGETFKTQAGEPTVRVESYRLLTKTLRPLPLGWEGLKDTETRMRKRYLDMLVNKEERDLFIKKGKFWNAVRTFLTNEGFIEVESPALEPIPGGADATPFVTHHNALDQDFYLRISLELYQKRMLVGGLEKIFEIGKIFRNEGIDKEHLQDYLQMEYYWAYANYEDLMDLTKRLYRYVIKETVGTLKTTYQGHEIDWGGNWAKLDYVDAFKEATGIDLDKEVSEEELSKYAKENKIPFEDKVGKGRLIDSIYKRMVRPFIVQPTFLIHHPVEVSALAKRVEDKPSRTERIQVLVGGTETCNGYSELNDPVDQYERFAEQEKLHKDGDEEAQRMDTDFVEALEYGMPPA